MSGPTEAAPAGAPAGSRPVLHLLCGKIAAGKSTLAADLAAQPATLLIAEDRWLARLYPGEIASLEDYARCSRRLRAAIGDHVETLLRAGLSVVLDFPANTRDQRRWLKGLVEGSGADHRLHLLEVPDAVCKARLRRRNAEGKHEYAATEAQFEAFTRHFLPPSPDEGLTIVVHPHEGDDGA